MTNFCHSADENVYTLEFLLSAPVPKTASAGGLVDRKMIIEDGESEEEDAEMGDSGEVEWMGLDEDDSD